MSGVNARVLGDAIIESVGKVRDSSYRKGYRDGRMDGIAIGGAISIALILLTSLAMGAF